jgi:hypothetical protein
MTTPATGKAKRRPGAEVILAGGIAGTSSGCLAPPEAVPAAPDALLAPLGG